MRIFLCTVLLALSMACPYEAQAARWQGIVQGNNSGWTAGPKVPSGAIIYISANGTVCCATQNKNPLGDKKCRQSDTRHAEGAFVISIPGFGNIKYADFEPLRMPQTGRLQFWIEDTKHSDNTGSYSVTVEW